jgi:hypothetical protein
LLAAIADADIVPVTPDRFLGRRPLAELPGHEPGTYLVEDHLLALVAVPQLLPELISNADGRELTKDLLLLGDVDFDRFPDRNGATRPFVATVGALECRPNPRGGRA